MARRGLNDVPRKLHLMPYDLLRAIHRPTTGRAYELLGQSLDRLVSTTIKTNIRAENRREATFSWLDGWTQLVDERTERRSEEHTSEPQSLMRISYAVFCLQKKKLKN